MADATISSGARVAPAAGTQGRGWVTAVPGVLFVLTFLGGIFAAPQSPDVNGPGRAWVDFIATRGNQIGMLVAGFSWVIAGMLLIVFMTRLYQRVYGDAAGRDPLALVATAAAGGLVAAGGALSAALPGAIIFGQIPAPTNADVVRVMSGIGFPVAMVAGMFALALAVVTIALRAQRSGYFGRVLGIYSYIAAAAAVASFMFFPAALVLIWALIVAVVLARRPAVL